MSRNKRPHTVFFYGLFMDPDLLRQQGLHPSNPRLASLPGHQLVIGQRASLRPQAEAEVWGLVMELPATELKQLYSEPSVREYVPQWSVVNLAAGGQTDAVVYVLPEQLMAGSNPAYAKQLTQVATRLGLPAVYVKSIMP
ncbi:gamma-glutamylcyclotransferase family protein [Marinicella meishanensis]|uniref:gamma-glutamylcyclotransferase family protein n=1 Tax=Marinicella meishanensis TaxID=2873263 RepID=UPI001CBB83CC|nr:gamma-glutamylcyclotransferase family protein [Marinicella sp. NBU2979]